MLHEYVLVHTQIDNKNKNIEHMVLKPIVYKKRSGRKYILYTVKIWNFLKYLL